MNIPIFLSSDNNYTPFVATTMASICDNTDSFCEFYVLDGGISKENQEKICELKNKFENFSIEFKTIELELIKDFSIHNHLSLAAYNRLFIANLFPNIKKALYFDVDVIAIKDITEIFNTNLDNYIIGAAKDMGYKEYIDPVRKNMDLSFKSVYFNSGVLLMDLEKWRNFNITKVLFEIEERYRVKILNCDQDLLNKFFENNYKLLKSSYNSRTLEEDTVVLHFYHRLKPWQADFSLDQYNKPYKLKGANFFWHYAEMTPFYNEILKRKEDFLNSNILYKRLNKMVAEGKIK